VVTVVPRGVHARRHFGAGAVGVALHGYGCDGLTATAVRKLVGGMGPMESGAWPTLRRWVGALGRSLFRAARAVAEIVGRRSRAARAAVLLAAFAPPRSDPGTLAGDVFNGAVVAAAAA
jgi:hypothetical protein